jgi:hypothetical protein
MVSQGLRVIASHDCVSDRANSQPPSVFVSGISVVSAVSAAIIVEGFIPKSR